MCVAVSAFVSVSGFAQTFTTTFDGTENPLSENGSWSHNDRDWTKVRKVNGMAYGTQTATAAPFRDASQNPFITP